MRVQCHNQINKEDEMRVQCHNQINREDEMREYNVI